MILRLIFRVNDDAKLIDKTQERRRTKRDSSGV